MREVTVTFDVYESPTVGKEIGISVGTDLKEELVYKILIGRMSNNTAWETLREFSDEPCAVWVPEQEGTYMAMVQARQKEEKEPARQFNYIGREEIEILPMERKNDKQHRKTEDDIQEDENLNIEPVKIELEEIGEIKEALDDCEENNIAQQTNQGYNIVGETGLQVKCKQLGDKMEKKGMKKNELRQTELEKEMDVKDRNVTIGDLLGSLEKNDNIIKTVTLNSKKYTIGDKVWLHVTTDEEGEYLYKYSIKKHGVWSVINDYCSNPELIFTAKEAGEHKLKVECKRLDTVVNGEDVKIVTYSVEGVEKPKIVDFRCNPSNMKVNNEINMSVEIEGEQDRIILCKFIKVNELGQAEVVQEYSTKKSVTYIETKSGRYKMLCLIKDMYSQEKYDFRAALEYEVIEYDPIVIEEVVADLSSPQSVGKAITLKPISKGGKSIEYRYMINSVNENVDELMKSIIYTSEMVGHSESAAVLMDGSECSTPNRLIKESLVDTGYIKDASYKWLPTEPNKYVIMVFAKDAGSSVHESSMQLFYEISDEHIDDVVIEDVKVDKDIKRLGKGESLRVEVEATGNTELLYSFVIEKGTAIIGQREYSDDNTVKFKARESGEYKLRIYVKSKFSQKNHECYEVLPISVPEFLPSEVEHMLVDKNQRYTVGESITVKAISKQEADTLYKWRVYAGNRISEESEFSSDCTLEFTPKIKGEHDVVVYIKNKKSKEKYDDVAKLRLDVKEVLPIISTVLSTDKSKGKVNETITLLASSTGGKDVQYKFYVMEEGEWDLMQSYSRKDYLSFMPFKKGEYKAIVLAKSQEYDGEYEDFATIKFEVVE